VARYWVDTWTFKRN